MPTEKKRINLTIPDQIYQRLLAYKEKYGVSSDATACLQLITQQLNAQEESELMLNLLRNSSTQQLLQLSQEGFSFMKEEMEKGNLTLPPQKKAP